MNELPKRCNSSILRGILLSFLESNNKIVKLRTDIFNDRSPKYVSNAISRYSRKHDLPIVAHCISNEIYLEKS